MLLRHSLFYLLARGIPGLLNFAALALYTRLLSPGSFGNYALVIASVTVIRVVLFQWLQLVLARFLSANSETPTEFRSGVLAIFVSLICVVSAAGGIMAWMWPDPVWQRLIVLAVILLATESWLELNLTLAAAQFSPGRYGRMLLSKALLAIIIGTGLAWNGFGAAAPIGGLIVGSITANIVFGQMLWRGAGVRYPDRLRLKEYLRYGMPLAITFALGWIISSSDRMLIAWLMDEASVGVYAAGYDLTQQSIGLLLSIVQIAAYPLAVNALERQGTAAARVQMLQNGELISGIAIAAAAAMAVLAPLITQVMVGKEFSASCAILMPWIALAAALNGIKAFHFDMAFHIGRQTQWLIPISAIGALLNIALNILLIPHYGILGAAYATVLAFAVATVLSALLSSRVFPMPSPFPILRRAAVVGMGSALGSWIGGSLFSGLMGLVSGLFMALVLAVVACWMLDLAGIRTLGIGRLVQSG